MLSIIYAILLLARIGDVHCYEDWSACWTDTTYVSLNNDAIDTRREWQFVNSVYQQAKR